MLDAAMGWLPERTEIVACCRGPYCVLAPQAVERLLARGYRASITCLPSPKAVASTGQPTAARRHPRRASGSRQLSSVDSHQWTATGRA